MIFYQSVIHIILPQVIECLKDVLLGNSVQHHNINIDVTIMININIIINIKLLKDFMMSYLACSPSTNINIINFLKDFMMSYLACSSSTCSLLGSVTLGTGIGEPGS